MRPRLGKCLAIAPFPAPEARAAGEGELPLGQRLWIYQQERFPLLGHGLLIGAFSFSAVSFSCVLRGQAAFPSLGSILVAFGSCFFFFLQLRVADEFKDREEDARWRPYRP